MTGSMLKVVYTRGEDGYIVAECPQLPGCMSQGKTREEASKNIADAIESVLAVRMRQFLKKPDVSDANDDEQTFCVKGPELIAV
jgi:predicted RNase H-like HicB family nuclease